MRYASARRPFARIRVRTFHKINVTWLRLPSSISFVYLHFFHLLFAAPVFNQFNLKWTIRSPSKIYAYKLVQIWSVSRFHPTPSVAALRQNWNTANSIHGSATMQTQGHCTYTLFGEGGGVGSGYCTSTIHGHIRHLTRGEPVSLSPLMPHTYKLERMWLVLGHHMHIIPNCLSCRSLLYQYVHSVEMVRNQSLSTTHTHTSTRVCMSTWKRASTRRPPRHYGTDRKKIFWHEMDYFHSRLHKLLLLSLWNTLRGKQMEQNEKKNPAFLCSLNFFAFLRKSL